MNWAKVEQQIQSLRPGRSAILKCDGVTRRVVTSNGLGKIGMRVGVTTSQTKIISYDMMRYAFDVLQATGRFDSVAFRRKYADAYATAPCRYSMTGGVLVELGLAKLVPDRGGTSCYYIKP